MNEGQFNGHTEEIKKNHYGEKIKECSTCFNENLCGEINAIKDNIFVEVDQTDDYPLMKEMRHYLLNILNPICISEDVTPKIDIKNIFENLNVVDWKKADNKEIIKGILLKDTFQTQDKMLETLKAISNI